MSAPKGGKTGHAPATRFESSSYIDLRAPSAPVGAHDVLLTRALTKDGPLKGRLRVEWHELSDEMLSTQQTRPGELRVFLDDSPTPMQVIKTEVHVPRDELVTKLRDIDGDTYPDLIFINNYQLPGPYHSVFDPQEYQPDVYLWNVSLGRFVQDKLLSQKGEIEQTKKANCVVVTSFCKMDPVFPGYGTIRTTVCYESSIRQWFGRGPRKNCEMPSG